MNTRIVRHTRKHFYFFQMESVDDFRCDEQKPPSCVRRVRAIQADGFGITHFSVLAAQQERWCNWIFVYSWVIVRQADCEAAYATYTKHINVLNVISVNWYAWMHMKRQLRNSLCIRPLQIITFIDRTLTFVWLWHRYTAQTFPGRAVTFYLWRRYPSGGVSLLLIAKRCLWRCRDGQI